MVQGKGDRRRPLHLEKSAGKESFSELGYAQRSNVLLLGIGATNFLLLFSIFVGSDIATVLRCIWRASCCEIAVQPTHSPYATKTLKAIEFIARPAKLDARFHHKLQKYSKRSLPVDIGTVSSQELVSEARRRVEFFGHFAPCRRFRNFTWFHDPPDDRQRLSTF